MLEQGPQDGMKGEPLHSVGHHGPSTPPFCLCSGPSLPSAHTNEQRSQLVSALPPTAASGIMLIWLYV